MKTDFEFTTVLLYYLEHFKINLDQKSLKDMELYFNLLSCARKKINLVGKLNMEEVVEKLFVDSLLGLKVISDSKIALVDVGCGAGFPGMVIKIAQPEIHLSLLDSSTKKINFLSKVCSELELDEVKLIRERAEKAGHNPGFREKFDVAVAKALAGLSQLVELCAPLVKQGGQLIAWKGCNINEEVELLGSGYKLLGLDNMKVESFTFPEKDHATSLVIFNKSEPTPEKYPRSYQAIRRD